MLSEEHWQRVDNLYKWAWYVVRKTQEQCCVIIPIHGAGTPTAACAEVLICGQMDPTIRVASHFGSHRTHTEAADIKIKIQMRLKWTSNGLL